MVLTANFDGGPTQLVEGRRRAWRRNFNGNALNPDIWTISKAPGMSVAVSGGSLQIAMNTNINEETVIQSVEGFTLPFRVQFHHSMSQRIVNQEVYLEMVNATGDTYTGWMFDGATTTQAKSVHANGGNSNPASPTGVITVAATASTSVVREIDAKIDSVDLSDRSADSSSGGTIRWVKTRTTLDPDEKYYVRLRFKNLGTAPASNTTVGFDTIIVQDTNDILVDVSGGRGNNTGNRGVPVVVNTMPTTNVQLSASATSGTATTSFRGTAVTNAASSVKASAGKLFTIYTHNPNASAVYLNVYNVAAPTVGTTTPAMTFHIPAGGTLMFDHELGVNFTAAIVLAATDTSTILSAVAPATPLVVTGSYI